MAIDPQAHTAVYFITHGADGHVFSYLRKGSAASRMRPADLPFELIRQAKFFHTSGISQAISDSACDTVFAAVEAARGAGVRIAYDSNLRLRLWPLARARAVVRATIALADYFLLSVDDAEVLCGRKDVDAILDWCHEGGAKVVALKLGAAGVAGSDSKRREKIAGHAVNCVDATGAGDCFAGALLARMAAGDDFWEGLHYANAAAALATTGFGAVAPLPRPDAVRRLLAGSVFARATDDTGCRRPGMNCLSGFFLRNTIRTTNRIKPPTIHASSQVIGHPPLANPHFPAANQQSRLYAIEKLMKNRAAFPHRLV